MFCGNPFRGGLNMGWTSRLKTPVGAVLMLVVTVVLSALTVAASVSGQLTAAAVSAAGLVTIVLIIAMLNAVGSK